MSAVDVLAAMDKACELHANGAYADAWEVGLDGIAEARAAVAELMECCEVTVKAFEALGRTDNIVAQLESHRECERALVEQKAVLARVGGAK